MGQNRKTVEDAFFIWLSRKVPSEHYEEIKTSFPRINMLMVKGHVLPQSATDMFVVTSPSEIEECIKKANSVFVGNRARAAATRLLSYYRAFLKHRQQEAKKDDIKPIKAVGEQQKKEFAEWLAKTVSSTQLSSYYQAFIEMEETISSKQYGGYIPQLLSETTKASEIEALIKELNSNYRFVHTYKSGTKISMLRQFARFLKEKEQNQAKLNTQQKDVSEMSSELAKLLQDDQYAELKAALISKGVKTVDAFKKMNLWVFMNENGLYNISKRYAIFNQLKRNEEQDTETGESYQLITKENCYSGKTPAEALLRYCEAIAQKLPLRFRAVIGAKEPISGTKVITLNRTAEDDLQLKNPAAYISAHMDLGDTLRYAKFVSTTCRYIDNPVLIEIVGQESKQGELASQTENTSNLNSGAAQNNIIHEEDKKTVIGEPSVSDFQIRVEKAVLKKDVEGIVLDELYKEFPYATAVSIRQIKEKSTKLVDLQSKIVHIDAFVDFEDAAEKLHDIIEKLLVKNNGYVSSVQLFEYARAEMQMFLNDNDVCDERSVYCIAKYLFEKVHWKGIKYAFSSLNHISRCDEALGTNLDVIIKYARDAGGIFSYDGLVQYLTRVGIKTGNLRVQMQIGSKPLFFYYNSDELITAESMKIDEDWFSQTRKALERLFADMGDHVVLRSINPIWYEQLPTLPGYRPWTPLLLQYVLRLYSEKLGARTIGSELVQKYDVLHSMVVSSNSEIQTFADTVVAYIIDSGIEQRQFEAEQLRRLLVYGKLIAGGELIWHMPKAIGSDSRFAWDAAGENVTLKV